ncbi:MAG: MBL fold metallo-hydrolase [Brevundimonas sp.]|jgi:glyoxylase-like metal-dependent hydrolase (beta-lactamase superfamily II)|uniref:MBL fold metallo-hydrolase n=1 Tax=Brevundimonas sp. TaxID=1871086 RepID=UPI00391A890E
MSQKIPAGTHLSRSDNGPDVRGFFDPATHTITYLVSDPATAKAAIIDPVLDFEAASARTSTRSIDAVLTAMKEAGLELDLVLETHAHADHLSAAEHLRRMAGVPVGIGAHITRVQSTFAPLFGAHDVGEDGAVFDRLYQDGERFTLGTLSVEVLHTPGHTPACVSYLIGDALFVGDTLFMPDYGTARADFPGGSASTLYRSIQRLLALPENTRMFVGHDYLPEGRSDYRFETTVGEQRRSNIHVGGGVTEEAFVQMREARDATLKAPQLIMPSLQINIRAGALPPEDADGRRYLKMPLNTL